jgi:hypothetical protein
VTAAMETQACDSRALEGGEGVDARVVMEMIINPSASEKMAKGGLDIGGLAVVDGVYAERRFVSIAGSDGWYRAYGCG